MILCPLQNTAVMLSGTWLQKRPFITQGFGEHPEIYAPLGIKAHDGIDFRAPIGTQVFSPFEGRVKVEDSGNKAYGLHIRVFKDNLECVLGHLSEVCVKDGDYVYMAQKIAKTGDTGFSSAAHLHMGCRPFLNGKVQNHDNGYFGFYDFSDQMVTWKGSLFVDTI